jgi:signal transduction histidine kinase
MLVAEAAFPHVPITDLHRRFGSLAAEDDLIRVERVISFARVLVSAIALLAIWLDPPEPARYAPVTYVLAATYVAASILALLWLRRRTTLKRGEALLSHAADIAVAAALTLFTEGPNSPFFTFFVYSLLAAAYRWGLYETLLTTTAAAVLILVEAILVDGYLGGLAVQRIEGQFDVNHLIMRVVYLWIIGMCVGYLGETAHQRRRETAAITSLGREAWLNAGQGLLKSVLGPVLQLFGSTRALTMLKGRGNRIAVWRSELSSPSGELHTALSLEDPQRAMFFSDSSSEAWHATRRVGNSIDVVMLDRQGARMRGAHPTPEITSFMTFFKCRSVISVPVSFRDAVIGRVFLLDPCIPLFERESAIQLGQRIASEIAPAAHNVFRLRRLRSRAEARERARIARELHDGLLQSISAAELRVDVVRRKIAKVAADDAAELSRVQAALSGEVRGLRMLTRRMQAPVSVPNDLQQALSELITRFERESGIAVRFETDFDADLTLRTRHEIVRIVQEGLTNIRKHSGAKHVMVRLASMSGSVRLVIEDDGRGFSFSGRRSQRELEVMSAGPLIIRERVRALRGELNVVSMPGKGARLHVKVPATQ